MNENHSWSTYFSCTRHSSFVCIQICKRTHSCVCGIARSCRKKDRIDLWNETCAQINQEVAGNITNGNQLIMSNLPLADLEGLDLGVLGGFSGK
mmetsp:Transcript_13588/g.20459  ORF Transcript_13588/g.20459 Transcript_13588/m.20459 type:complete len:94 (+) Transcript_13588:1060-1341(+)